MVYWKGRKQAGEQGNDTAGRTGSAAVSGRKTEGAAGGKGPDHRKTEYPETFLEDGWLPISNNLCEANIKPFATARKAWLFADTPKGAKATAVPYTLVESARANGLDVYEYLKYLLTEMPNNHHPEHPEVIDRYLPWSGELPEECRLKHRNKKCLKK